MDNIQLSKDLEKEVELVHIILHQNNHKTKNLDADINVAKTKVKDNNLLWAKGQYLTFNFSVLKTFFANSIDLSIDSKNSFESKKVDWRHK